MNLALIAQGSSESTPAFGGVLLIIVLATTVWVAIDIDHRGMSGWWIAGVLLLWIVFFPIYLFARRENPKGGAVPQGAPPNWYPDPEGAPGWRWWDGTTWTEHRSGQHGPGT